MTSLRDRLRADTAPRHDRVDRAYSALDLARPEDLRAFLRSQLLVLRAVRCRAGRHVAAAADLASRMTAALEADLHGLGDGPIPSMGERQLDPTSVLYMLLGSRLGSRVLHRRWLEATDPTVAGAGRFLELAPPSGAWRAFCAELTQRPPQGPEADRIVSDAETIFDLHLAALAGHIPLLAGGVHA